jgi:diaminopimelate decarboxylase
MSVRELLAEHGSPLWLADADRVRERLRGFRAAWRAEWPDTEVAYSYKTNRLLAFLCALDEEGAAPEVVCEAEYRLAREMVGASGDEIVVNGPAKPATLLERAAADGALVVADSRAELDRAAAAGVGRVGLRVAVDGHTGHPSRFGIAAGEITRAAAQAGGLRLRVEALSCHVVSSSRARSSPRRRSRTARGA